MGLQDRDYNRSGGKGGGDYGEGGGFGRAMRRMFVEGDNFFGWSIPLYRLFGITVKIHIFYLIYLVVKMIGPLNPGAAGFWYSAFFWGSGFLFVLLHEYGHCFACRAVGGQADQIVMWPLGGLAFCRPPHHWKAALITTVCGPLVNVAIALSLAGVMMGLGASWRTALFNPLDMWSALLRDEWYRDAPALWKVLLYASFLSNAFMAMFNLCVPMFPMDGGRIVQELLWWKIGYKRSMMIATNLGLFMAVVVGVFGIVMNQNMLISIALFGGITCFMQRKQLEFIEETPAWSYDTDRGYKGFGGGGAARAGAGVAASPPEDKAYKAALARQEKEKDLQAEVDRILDKIREKGMQSLSSREKAILKDATERTRGKG
jgi:Zn-dependent protease